MLLVVVVLLIVLALAVGLIWGGLTEFGDKPLTRAGRARRAESNMRRVERERARRMQLQADLAERQARRAERDEMSGNA